MRNTTKLSSRFSVSIVDRQIHTWIRFISVMDIRLGHVLRLLRFSDLGILRFLSCFCVLFQFIFHLPSTCQDERVLPYRKDKQKGKQQTRNRIPYGTSLCVSVEDTHIRRPSKILSFRTFALSLLHLLSPRSSLASTTEACAGALQETGRNRGLVFSDSEITYLVMT
jgi:hypothetical protein